MSARPGMNTLSWACDGCKLAWTVAVAIGAELPKMQDAVQASHREICQQNKKRCKRTHAQLANHAPVAGASLHFVLLELGGVTRDPRNIDLFFPVRFKK